MPTIILETQINAPANVCFDLMRDIRIVNTNEKTVFGVTNGRISLGQTVTFAGRHFGIRQRLTVKVVEFERPSLLVDEMTEGRFKSFKHVHEFGPAKTGTLMRDTLSWTSPFGIIGKIGDKLLLERHLRNLVTTRNAKLKEIAERQ